MNRYYKYIFWVLTFNFLAISIVGQNNNDYTINFDKELNQFSVENWKVENGLPSNLTQRLFMSSKGELWLTTVNGVARFDGKEFTTYNKHNTEEITTGYFREIDESQDGTLWMSTKGDGVMSFKNGVFKSWTIDQGLATLEDLILVDSEGKIWACDSKKGLFYLKDGKIHFVNVNEDAVIGLNNVTDIVQDQKGVIWLGAEDQGLYTYKENKLSLRSAIPAFIENSITTLGVLYDNTLFIGTEEGLYELKDGKVVQIVEEKGLYIADIEYDKANRVFLASSKGLLLVDRSTKSVKTVIDRELANPWIRDLMFDNENSIWLAVYKSGLTHIKAKKFISFTDRNGLRGQFVNAISEFNKGEIIIGHDNGTIDIIKNNKVSKFPLRYNLSNSRVRDLFRDSKGNLWISLSTGLIRVRPDGKEEIISKKHSELPEGWYRFVYEDLKNNIWISTSAGIFKMSEDKIVDHYNSSDGLVSNTVMSMNVLPNGSILFGTNQGLNLLETDGNFKLITKESGFNATVIFHIYTDQINNTWLATNSGLYLYQDDKFIEFSLEQGLLNDTPFYILEDEQENFWLPSNMGVMKIAKKELFDLKSGSIRTINCKLYSKNDGLPTNQCNSPARSLIDSFGNFWIPTEKGVVKITPKILAVNQYKPPMYIDKLILNDEVVINQTGDKLNFIEIHPSDWITIYYSALSYYNPDNVRYSVKLDGKDTEWRPITSERSVQFINLSVGDYTFNLIASNNDGLWNNDALQYTIKVVRPWSNTWWFYLLIVILIIGITLLIYYLRLKNLRRRQSELEKIVAERISEIKEVNSELIRAKEKAESVNIKLKEKTKELEAFNNKMIDREMRLIELKKEVNKLSRDYNLEIPYPEFENN